MTDDVMSWSTPIDDISNVVPDASPYLFETPYPGNIIVQGGVVSKIEYSRDDVSYYDVGLVAGVFFLPPGDAIRVTIRSPRP